MEAPKKVKRRLLSVGELSVYLGLSKDTIYTWKCKGKIPYTKMGRLLKFDLQQLDLWIRNKTTPAIEQIERKLEEKERKG